MDIFDLAAKLTLDSSQYEQGLSQAAGSASGFASKLGGGFATAAKVGATAVAAVTTAAVAAGVAFAKAVDGVAQYGDNIDKMSQKMNLSAEAYQEWDAIMQHSGTSIETMQSSMKTLANAVDSSSEAFERLGISQEQIANMSNEELFAATITALQGVESETERTALAGKLLGRGATELGALLNMSAEETEAMRQRVHELGGVMSDEAIKASAAYADSIQDMKTAFSGLSRNLIAEFLPNVTKVTDGLTEIFSGDTNKGVGMISSGVDGIIKQINQKLPSVISAGGKIVSAIGSAIQKNLPKIVQTGSKLVVQLVSGIVKSLPEAAKSAGSLITTITEAIAEGLPEIINAGVETISALAEGISNSLPELLPALTEVVLNIVDGLTDPNNIGAVVDAALSLITGLADGLIEALPVLLERLPEIVDNIVTALVENAPKLATAAVQIISSLAEFLLAPENIGLILDAGVQIIGSIAGGVLGAVGGLAEVAGSVVGSLAEFIVTAATGDPELGAAAKATVEEFVSGLKTDVSEKLPKLASDVMSQLASDLSSAESVADIFEAGANAAHNFMLGIYQSMPELWEVLKAIMNLTGNPGAAAALDVFGATLEAETAQRAREAWNSVDPAEEFDEQAWLDSLDPVARRIAEGSMDALREETEAGAEKAGEAGRQKFAGAIKGGEKEAEESGLNLAKGFARGILNGIADVQNAASQVASAASSMMRVTLQEKSPSKVGREIGEFFSEGFAIGIDAKKESVIERAKELAKAARDSLDISSLPGYDEIRDQIRPRASQHPNAPDMSARMDEVLAALNGIRNNIGGNVVLDSGEIVGRIDGALGQISAQKARGLAWLG